MRLNLHIEQAEATSALLAQNIEQSKKINSLHDQLSKHQAFLEQKEPKRERSLSERADFHQKMHQTTENNQEALVRLNELLRKQEELIKATKKTMNL
jgi:hypothetical protein